VPARWRRGRLHDDPVPEQGERFDAVHDGGGVVIEHIVSSASVEPTGYDQDHDEWVVVLAGSATLTIEGEAVTVAAGDWLFLPAGTRHTVTGTEAGTQWLAVHLPPPDGSRR
jgi:quercetin dioxygenase-like cupin family protein